MYGSRASNEYGKGGTLNAMGSSAVEIFELKFAGSLAASNEAPICSAPRRAAPATLPVTRNSRRFIESSARDGLGRLPWGLYVFAVRPLNSLRAESGIGVGPRSLDARECPTGRF